MDHGCHKSATDHGEFLREEFADFIQNKFWTVLPYRLAKDFRNLQLSPAAVKEERDRRPRVLCDHTYTDGTFEPVNVTTTPHATPEAMQFGRALESLLRLARRAHPKFGPVRLSKHDIKDGFYRMHLRAADCMRLAVVLPRFADEEPLIAIPMSCTMGWVQSPPSFCIMSETTADIANDAFAKSPCRAPPHRLSAEAAALDQIDFSWDPLPRETDDLAATHRLLRLTNDPHPEQVELQPDRVPACNDPFHRPVSHTDVFVDDFLQLGQGGTRRLNAQRNHLLHAIDHVLAQPLPHENRNEAVSLKKLRKGDGS